MNIYVSNLSFAIQDEDLRDFFADYGEVSSAKIIMDKATNRSRGFGFVEMADDAAAAKAIEALNGALADGRTMKVSEAKPREERPARQGGGGGFNRNGGGGGQRRSYNESSNRW